MLASPAQAATLSVNSNADTDDGACTTASGGCTLREAIDAANLSSSVADTIDFALGSEATITLASELPTITDSAGLTIDGGGADITISGDRHVQALRVSGGANLTLANLMVTRGYGGLGGAIENSGTLTVSNSTFSGNTATSAGGGIFNDGSLAVSNSTFSGNSVSGSGGAIYNAPQDLGTVGLFNSTIANNSASGVLRGAGALSNGGGRPSIDPAHEHDRRPQLGRRLQR
jgi:CSLREA domain-containing protein